MSVAYRSVALVGGALLLAGSVQVHSQEPFENPKPAIIPLDQALFSDGQIFPASLSRMESGCLGRADKGSPMLEDSRREWYSKHLVAAREPSLPSIAAKSPSELHLRFTWLPSFDPPVVVRFSATREGRGRLTSKMLSGAGGYDPGKIAELKNRQVTREEARRITALIASSQILKEPGIGCRLLGVDGARWIVEIVENGSYHFIDRWSPRSSSVRDVGLLMLELSKLKIGDIY